MPTTRINISISQWCWAIDARVVAFYRLTPLAYIATLRLHKLLLTGLMAHTHRYTRWGARTGTRAPYRITSIHIHISCIEAKCLGACLHCAERQRHITKWPQPHCYWPNNFECHYAINCSRSLLRYIYIQCHAKQWHRWITLQQITTQHTTHTHQFQMPLHENPFPYFITSTVGVWMVWSHHKHRLCNGYWQIWWPGTQQKIAHNTYERRENNIHYIIIFIIMMAPESLNRKKKNEMTRNT